MDIFGNLLNALGEIWKSIGIPQKVSIILVTIATAGVIAFIVYLGSRPDWVILYSNLDSKVAGKVYDTIKEGGVKIKLADGGRTIMVPSGEADKLKLKVSAAGINVERSGGVGLELFENQPLGMTDKQQQITYQRAIQGELQKMIGEMPGIAAAQVLLTLPEKRAFRKNSENPRASVMLTLARGASISNEQINSIRYLVSSSVSGMTPQSVTITDNKGALLARQADDDNDKGDPSGILELKGKMERQLKEKAEAILRPVVGPDNVVAMVSCDVDFDTLDRIVEDYQVDKTAVVYEKTSDESTAKMNGPAGGKVGTQSNMVVNIKDASPQQQPEEKMTADSKKTSEKKSVIPKTIEKSTTRGGKLKKLTVAVTVKKVEGKSWDVKNFEALVSAAVGADSLGKGNSTIKVTEMDFAPAPKETVQEAPFADTMMFNIEKYSKSPMVRPIIGVAILFVLFRIFRKYFARSSEGVDLALGHAGQEVYGEDLKQIASEEEKKQEELLTVMDNLQAKATSNSPQKIASMMESWLSTDQGA
jgi:flagellar M-ring protein FliF